MTESGIRAALRSGAAVVVAKSTNESIAVRDQLDRADYRRLNEKLESIAWRDEEESETALLCRSGLMQDDAFSWLEQVAKLDEEAQQNSAYVAGSLIPANVDELIDLVRHAETMGLRVLELNVGAPHGGEAPPGTIVLERDVQRVRVLVSRVREVFSGVLWAKLTGMSEDVPALAGAAKDGGADAVVMIGRFMAMLPDLETRTPMLGTNAAYGGRWALPITCYCLAATRKRLGGEYPLVGTNGARDGQDIARMMLAGAGAVELSSAVMIHGFHIIGDALCELTDYLETSGLDARDLIGQAADRLQSYDAQQSNHLRWRHFVPPESFEPTGRDPR